ncbi:crystal et79 [Fusarium pseudoanthophilum]|uniref:Crystal et79 n=1 Tax=Fusarium pseudoanthophilum TaxID=48495 RepID=A0A8H5NLD7_9HYPO|nr:crystal et79 [Fusarium pseudoanthophilum]
MTIFGDIAQTFSSTFQSVVSVAANQPRKIAASLVNNTQQTLTWVDSGVDHGKRSDHAPDTIGPGDTGKWGIRSDGIQTGCEGWMEWRISDDGPIVRLDYNNPYFGSNSYFCDVNSAKYTVDWEGGKGDEATVKFILSNK